MKRSPRLETLERARLGFISNKKTNNEPLMRALADELERRNHCSARHWRKSSPYRALPKKTAKEILESCSAAVVGPGD